MPSADPRAAEIVKVVGEFEASVAAAETALAARDWPRIEALLALQHRLTQALANALDETRDARPQAFSDEVDRRVAAIVAQRSDQLRRLVAFNHLVKEKLSVLSRGRALRRQAPAPQPRILDLRQ